MKCGYCNYTDGLCYTSNPPQVKCTITGKFRYYGEECDAFPKATIVKPKHAIPCLICGETARLTDDYTGLHIDVCDKCKAAVMEMRKRMEQDPTIPTTD